MCEISLDNIVNLDSFDLIETVPKINSDISYSDFFDNFLIKNKPCVISNISTEWLANKYWTKNCAPNFPVLLGKYRDYEVTISNCKEQYFNAQKTEIITFEKYINYWENYIESNYSDEMPLLYLKDWHLRKKSKEHFYTTPIFFASDWLNEFFSEKTDDDYKFVYMGPKGTWTPFHADVFTSFSWSTNICGKKKWVLFPPGTEISLKDSLGNLPYDVTTCQCVKKYLEVIQNPGEAIFVPSGWYHQVWNLEDTISINHNWINGCNVKTMWLSIAENLNAVKKEIADCSDMEGWSDDCQVMLKALHGMDFKMFYDFLYYISDKRLQVLCENFTFIQFDTWELGKNHALFDLIKINEVLELFMKHTDFYDLNFIQNYKISPNNLFMNINNVLLRYK